MLQFLAKRTSGVKVSLSQSFSRKSPFSTGSARWSDVLNSGPKPHKRHRIRNFFIGTTLLFSGLSAGSIYYALRNDDFYYAMTTYVPFTTNIIDAIEDYRFNRAVQASKAEAGFEAPQKLKEVECVPIDGQIKATAVTTTKAQGASSSAKPPAKQNAPAPAQVKEQNPKKTAHKAPATAPASASATTSAAPSKDLNDNTVSLSAKPVAAQIVGSESHLGGGAFPKQQLDEFGVDSTLSEVDAALRSYMRAHNVDLNEDVLYSKVVSAVKHASDSVRKERERLKQNYSSQLKKSTAEFESQLEKDYLEAKKNLVESYNNRLQLALDAVTHKAVASANNKLDAQYNELYHQFGGRMTDYVEKERDGRLSRMKELQKDMETLQEAILSSGNILESEDGVVSFFVELGNLQRVLAKQEVTPLKPYLEALTKSLPSDPLVKAAVASISPSVKKYGVLSHTQLAARFSLIEPKIRQASLAPANAGIAGHLGSLAASQLLVRKEGLPEGNDVESVIARTQTHLQQGDVLRAVAEVNSLQGWPKKIAADWLDEGRKRSEVEFLVNVLADEGRLWSISRN